MLFIILAYYFSIFGYTFLYDHYIYNDDSGLNACENLLTCVMVTFDWAFKETGAVGSFLNANWYNATTPRDINWKRWFYDNLINIILIQIVINMVAGKFSLFHF